MKKVFFLMLAIAGMEPLFAQTVSNPPKISEIIFNTPKPKTLHYNFDFLLPNSNKITLELTDVTQLNALVNVDSLVEKVWLDLQPLKDSLTKPLVNRRVDYNSLLNGPQIRITEYPQSGTTYQYIKDELVQTKIEQDTVRIRLLTTFKTKADNEIRTLGKPYFIMLRLNNITDIALLPAGVLNQAIEMLRKDLEPALKKNKESRMFYAMYDVAKQKRMTPVSNSVGSTKRKYIEPYLQPALQYIRGSWAPSIGVGLQLLRGYYNGNREVFKLYWEPYFFFTRGISNDLLTQRNDFITFKYNTVRARQNNFPDVGLNFSIGYLVDNRGNWFEPATFKFAVPGLMMRNLNLEPEFVFNKFFKNFTPTIKLSLEIE